MNSVSKGAGLKKKKKLLGWAFPPSSLCITRATVFLCFIFQLKDYQVFKAKGGKVEKIKNKTILKVLKTQ